MADAHHSSTSRLLDVVREAQDQSLRLTDSNEHARARARLLQALDRADSRARAPRALAPSRSPRRWGLGTLAAAACVFALLFAWPEGRALEYEVDGVQHAMSEQIAAGAQARTLSFSDDTTIALAPGSRMHIEDLRANGATVVLETGRVDLAVHHERDTSWRVDAGPWSVHVTGTQFNVIWEPSTEHLRVAVIEGSVRVEGPEGELAELRGGDTLIRQRGKATIEPERRSVEPKSPQVASREVAPSDEPAVSEPRSVRKPKPKTRSWIDYFDDADYEAAWRALEAHPGLDAAARKASAATLLDLADLARYTKHADEAHALLEQLRERYPETRQASEAAFNLGRLADMNGESTRAATYLEIYLDEQPQGSHAEDALGRLLDAYDNLDSTHMRRAAASRYLDRFPDGPHADKAGKLLAK